MAEKTHRRAIEKRMGEIAQALFVLREIDEDWLYELYRRREQLVANDGFGSSGLGEGRGGSSESSTTERAALGRVGCKRPHFVKFRTQKQPVCLNCGLDRSEHLADPIGNTVEEVLELVDRATKALRSIPRKYTVIVRANDGRTGRQSTIDQCLACGRDVTGYEDDRIRAGYCEACYQAWRRYVASNTAAGVEPSHVVFRQHRQAAEARRQEQAS